MFELYYPTELAPLYPRPSADRPGKQPLPEGEILPLIEPTGIVYGRAGREWCLSGSMALHPVVHLHIIDREGRIFLQKRSMLKKLLPGRWDTSVGGHVSYGELALEALFRESDEELGLKAFNPIFLRAYPYQTERYREMIVVYAMLGHPQLHPSNEEVTEGKWWTVEEIEAATGKGVLTPNFESEFQLIKANLLALL